MSISVNNAVAEFLTDCEIRKFSPRTIRSYRNNINTFIRFCESVSVINADEINLPLVKKYAQHFVKSGRKGTYVNALLKTLKSFINWLWAEYEIGFDTAAKKYPWVKEDKPIITTFSNKDVKGMLEHCKGNDYMSIRDTCIITMFVETGIRCFELCNIKPQDIKDGYIVIEKGKNAKGRVVPITAPLQKAILRYQRCRDSYFTLKDTDDYFFLSFHGKMLTNSAIEHCIKQHSGNVSDDIRCSPHTLRHFFAQSQLIMGTDIYSLSRLLGHESIAITQTYLRSLSNETLIEQNKSRSVLMSI